MCYIMLILLVILYLFDFIVFLHSLWQSVPAPPFAKNGSSNPTQPPLEKGRGRSEHFLAFGGVWSMLAIYLIKQPKICIRDRSQP